MTTTATETSPLFQALWDEPLSDRGYITLNERDGRVLFHGEQHDEATILNSSRVAGLGIVLTVHLKGGTHWSGRGQRRGHRASIRTIAIQPALVGRYQFVQIGTGVLLANDEDRTANTRKVIDDLTSPA